MKTVLAVCVVQLLASAALAHQGLHLKWGGCPNHPAATASEDFRCDGSGPHLLHGTFSLDVIVPGVVAMDGIIDFLFATPDVPAFWQFQAGACNASIYPDERGLVLSDARPSTNCVSAENTNTLCGAGGTGCDGFLTAYAYGSVIRFPENRARLLLTMAKAAGLSTLQANSGTRAHFAFILQLSETNASEIGGACDGCMAGVSVTWNMAVFYNTNATNGREGVAIVVSSSDPGSLDSSVTSNCSGCEAVAVVPRRWGQLKALYR